MEPDPSRLIAIQDELQTAASAVIDDLELLDLASTVGRPVLVGSAALGLMVWRDIDVTVVCDRLEIPEILNVATALARHARVRRVEFRNDAGDWNTDPESYPDGLFVGVEYVDDQRWELDVWFIDEPDRQPDLAHLGTIGSRITDEARIAILTIKQHWHTHPEYSSHAVYEAVLDHGIRSVEQFEVHVESRRPGSDQS